MTLAQSIVLPPPIGTITSIFSLRHNSTPLRTVVILGFGSTPDNSHQETLLSFKYLTTSSYMPFLLMLPPP